MEWLCSPWLCPFPFLTACMQLWAFHCKGYISAAMYDRGDWWVCVNMWCFPWNFSSPLKTFRYCAISSSLVLCAWVCSTPILCTRFSCVQASLPSSGVVDALVINNWRLTLFLATAAVRVTSSSESILELPYAISTSSDCFIWMGSGIFFQRRIGKTLSSAPLLLSLNFIGTFLMCRKPRFCCVHYMISITLSYCIYKIQLEIWVSWLLCI